MQKVLSLLKEVKQDGSGWKACCPPHQDGTPSLSISKSTDGKILLHCHAGCPTEKVLDALGLKMQDLFPPKQPAQIIKTYDYTAADHQLLYQVVRFDPKDFRQRRPDGNGGWVWDLKGVARPLPLYRLPKLVGTGMTQNVYLCAGEKDADNVESLGLTTTTKSGGEKHWDHVDSAPLHGRPVVILQDKDETGAKFTEEIVADLHGKATSIKVLTFPGPHVKDVSDWMAERFSMGDDLPAMKTLLETLVATTPATATPTAPSAIPTASSSSLPETNDTGNAMLMATMNADTLRWLESLDLWLYWRKNRWDRCRRANAHTLPAVLVPLAVKAAVHRMVMAASTTGISKTDMEDQIDWGLKSKNRPQIENAVKICRTLEPIYDSGDDWDLDDYILGVNNGLLDLKTGVLRDNTPSDKVTMHLRHDYDPTAPCPRWEQFMLEIFDGDLELIRTVKEALGYTLTGSTAEQCWYLLYGKGANGKSTFLETVRYVMGSYGKDVKFTAFEKKARSQIPHDIADMVGKRLVTSSETSEGNQLNEERIKMLTGDGAVTACHKYGEDFTFRPHLKIWLAVNHLPLVKDTSMGFWRRMRPIPFTKSFLGSAADLGLEAKLKAEAPGILRWMVEGALATINARLFVAPAVLKLCDEYQGESDPLTDFLAEKCTQQKGLEIDATPAYQAYNEWSVRLGLSPREKLTCTAFGRRMTERFTKVKDSKSHRMVYLGVGLRGSTTPLGGQDAIKY